MWFFIMAIAPGFLMLPAFIITKFIPLDDEFGLKKENE